MRVISTEAYEFSELSKEAKKTAIENNRDFNFHEGWWDFVYEDAKEIGKLMGIEISDIYFTLWVQGAGACFEGTYRYAKNSVKAVKDFAPKDKKLHKIVEALFELQKKHFFSLEAVIKHSGHYYHENCTDISIDTITEYNGEIDYDGLIELLRDFMKWIYNQLYSNGDYLMSDEAIAESLEANEMEFTVDGKNFRYNGGR